MFGFYYHLDDNDNPESKTIRARYINLFESLTEPYLIKNSVADVQARKKQLEAIVDAAILYGMRAIGCSIEFGVIEYRWGQRGKNPKWLPVPVAVQYDGDEVFAEIPVLEC